MISSTLLASSIAFGILAGGDSGDDWPHLRGPGLDGHADSGGALGSGPIRLNRAWTSEVGSAYSGMAVAGGLLVTLDTDGELDHVVAFDAEDGRLLWRSPLGPMYLGHDGSMDGPISSPVIGLGMVFAIGPRGQLVALTAETGEVVWSKDLITDLGAPQPSYGFTTTPLLEGELLIVQAGGSEGRLLCAFDARTGEERWTSGEGVGAYQSPIAMDLAGRRQVVALGGNSLLAVAPETGELLWTHPLGEQDRASTGMATPIDDTRFFANVSGTITMYQVEWGEVPTEGDVVEEGYVVTELYRSRDMGNSYATPVHHEGHLYGYRGAILSCVDAETGARVWRSRPPGGEGLISVDDRLFVFGSQGVLTLVEATPEGYREVTRVRALEQSSFTWPSYARGCVYVRNHSQIACIEVAGHVGERVPPGGVSTAAGEFVRFVASVEAAENKQELIDAFLAEQEQFPILADGMAHFVFHDEVEDIVLVGNMVDGSRPDPMLRIAGTNFYHRSYPIEELMRWEYRFQVDYGEWRTDPLNPRTVPGNRGELSELATPGYESPVHIVEPAHERRGRLEELEYTSEALGNTRTLKIYLPHGYDEGEAAYPLLLVHQGERWLEQGQMANTLDNLIGESVRPLVAVFIPPIQRWWFEAGGTGTDKYIDMLATELVPHLETLYRLSPEASDRAVMGTLGFALTAGYATLRHPDVFAQAGMQSIALDDVTRHEFMQALEEGPLCETSYYLDWNLYEARDQDRGYDYAVDGQRVWAALETRGYSVTGGEAMDGHGWGSWRGRADTLLATLFPLD
jgi:enterochelin esterase-like enzyme/outer membrane protein assembly factor BamB